MKHQTSLTLHNYNTRSTYINFRLYFVLGTEFCFRQNLSARPLHLPIQHDHDNTPCSQRLRGKKAFLGFCNEKYFGNMLKINTKMVKNGSN